MMLSLGLFVFMRQTTPYQNMNRNIDYRWPTNNRIGLRPAAQFLGVDSEKITLSGVLLPELTGGKLSLLALELMAAQGKAWPLIEGNGTIYGMFVIESLSQTGTLFFADGSARRIEFTLKLLRVDESLTAMFGDLQQQADQLMGKVKRCLS
ncbi:phage protein U [Yersinia enterocolitica]|uniref:phage tail protein n=1 Tax=Yersinia enterocolitica TaxID=630 RepID=UPI000281998D|nr:phage tail protein [Yersinia enterocolitica]AJI81204.1 phage P2 GpU family protein [Yersinia enterocolitica]EKA27578.1 phage-related tail protein [Yersinia enterocolitica subsp. enterocolitica WA-314]ELI8285055.1 phage tail protein [Yersinia enterocolitica]KGA71898.1 phage P2 GpU family protein [Yersinia enterocolitica]KGA76767.1 phage P2 GpU family protein [Yersinia enterocolitica]